MIDRLVEEGYWPDTDGEVTAESGFDFVVETAGQNIMRWAKSLGAEAHDDFVMGTKIYSGSGAPGDRCGFVVRQTDDDNFYLIDYDHRGMLMFTEKENGEWHNSIIVRADAIKHGYDGNELWVVAQGDAFEVFINGEHVTQFKDETIPAGGVALVLTASGKAVVAGCSFMNSWLWEASAPVSGLFGGAPAEPTAAPSPAEPTATSPPAGCRSWWITISPSRKRSRNSNGWSLSRRAGTRSFREPYAYFEGTGNWFTPLASGHPHTQVIVAGTLTFYGGLTTRA